MISELSREFLVRSYRSGALLLDGEYKLSSGVLSPVYFNGKQLIEFGSGLAWCEDFLLRFFREVGVFDGQNGDLDFSAIFVPAYGAIPHGILFALGLFKEYRRNVAWLFDRKEEKKHGEKGKYVGTAPRKGMRILVIEDVVTTGRTLRNRICELIRLEAEIAGVLALFNRQEFEFVPQAISVSENLEDYLGVPFFSVATMTDLMELLGELGREEQLDRILRYRERRRQEGEAFLLAS